MDKAASKWAFSGLALVFALMAIGFYFSGSAAPTAAVLIGGGCSGGPPALGNWNLIVGGCLCQNDDLTVNGSVVANGVGGISLTMSNCTIRFNCAAPVGCGMLVQNGASLVMGNLSVAINASSNPFYFKILGPGNTMADIRNSTISGAGMSSGDLTLTGVYADPAGAGPTILNMANSTVINGYSGVVAYDSGAAAPSSSRVALLNNTIANNSNIGIYNNKINGTVIQNNVVKSNGPYGIFVQQSWGVYVNNNTVTYNNGTGIWVQNSNLTGRNITYNYIYKNNGDGIHNMNPLSGFDIKFNKILNNSGWGVWSFEGGSAGQCSIQNNTMCYNTNTTYWTSAPGGADYGGVPPMYNKFCVNVSRPIKGGCTNSDEVKFYVSGNPISWKAPPSGFTNCTLKIDNVYNGSVITPGAYEEASIIFNGTAVGDGKHNFTVRCDPYDNTADDDGGNYTRDTQGPQHSGQGSSGGSGGGGGPGCVANVTLAVFWYDGSCNVSYAVLSTNETTAHKNYTGGDNGYGSPKVVEWNETWTNFSWWNETDRNLWINWMVWANDSAGNWNSTDNATFQAVPCTESIIQASGGGSSSSGAAAPPSDCQAYLGNMTISKVMSARTVFCRPQTDFVLFNITFASPLEMTSKLTIEAINQPPDVPEPTTATYKYFALTAVNITDAYLSAVVAEFVVSGEWINETGLNESDIGLYRWNGKAWEAQPTVQKANTTNFYAELTSVETGVFAIAAAKSCPSCPAAASWGACVDDRQVRTDWACSEDTDFVCQNFTTSRNCVCPVLCHDTAETDCMESRKNVTTYSCSEETDFACVPKTEEVGCAPKLPQLLLPFWEDFTSAPAETQAVMALAAIVAVGCVAAAGYWWFVLRLHPERTERIKELIRKYLHRGGEKPKTQAEGSQPEKTFEEDDEYGT